MALQKNNHTQISNDFIDNQMKKLSGGAAKVFIAISRKTIGWHKDTDSISIAQIMNITGLSNRGAINCIIELEKSGMIKVFRRKSAKDYNYTNEYTIAYEESSQRCEESSPISSEESSQTKETKKTITKERAFAPPLLTDVKKYIEENNLTVNYNSFMRYYTASNWCDNSGKKVKNWKFKVVSWHNREEEKQKKEPISIYPEL
jgi:phage replication O-like protein O